MRFLSLPLNRDTKGNVSEWCLNKYHHPDDNRLSGAEQRAVRGGGWYSGLDRCYAESRSSASPHEENNATGFRVALIG
jgi:formylglycine-generating enzyme required for sulfatase activity